MSDFNVGGQAIIEGVMMRSAERVSAAVRGLDGEIRVQTKPYISFVRRYPILSLPFVRGLVTFLEMTVIGVKTLNFSADIAVNEAEEEEARKKGQEYKAEEKKSNKLMLAGTVVFSLALGIGVFFFLPLAISSWLGVERDALPFNMVAGTIRVSLLVAYMSLLALFDDFKRIFEYHGAEHKAIFAFENKAELTPESAQTFSRFHPRCGTSFLLIVALTAALMYSASDTVFAVITGAAPTLLERFTLHLVLLPFVAGISYELLRFSGKTLNNPITRFLIQPGLWLQRITTREPDLAQLAVAIVALEEALAVEKTEHSISRIDV